MMSNNAKGKLGRGRAGRGSSYRLAVGVFLLLTSITAIALAGALRYSASHQTSKSPKQVWAMLTSYSQICDEGCKYHRDNVVVIRKIDYKSTASSWYTWAHVTNTLKEVKYYTHVSVKFDSKGNLVANNRQLDDSDAALIDILEKRTGLKHSPAFDRGNTRTTATKSSSAAKTKVTRITTLTASGFLALWEGKIRKAMKKGAVATFRNIEK